MLLLAFAVISGITVRAAEPERLRLGKDTFELYVRTEGASVHVYPSVDAPVVSRLNKGMYYYQSHIVSPTAIDKYGAQSEQWIELKGYSDSNSHGWVHRRDFVTSIEFKPVERWPVKTYRADWGEQYLYCRFEPDGRTEKMLSLENKSQWKDTGYITISDGIVLSGCGIYLYDEKKGIRCPDILPGSTCFTQEEINTFLKAKSEGRQPPKITYDDGQKN